MPIEYYLMPFALVSPLLGYLFWILSRMAITRMVVHGVARKLGGRGLSVSVGGVVASIRNSYGDSTTAVSYAWSPPEPLAITLRATPDVVPPVPESQRLLSTADSLEDRLGIDCARPGLARAILDDETCHRLAQAQELTRNWSGMEEVTVVAAPTEVTITCRSHFGTDETGLAAFVGHANAVFLRVREVLEPIKRLPPHARVTENARCPLCAAELTSALHLCAGCRTLYHEDCHTRAGACLMPGCPESRPAHPCAGADAAIIKAPPIASP